MSNKNKTEAIIVLKRVLGWIIISQIFPVLFVFIAAWENTNSHYLLVGYAAGYVIDACVLALFLFFKLIGWCFDIGKPNLK